MCSIASEYETSTFLECVILPSERETSKFLDCVRVLYIFEICFSIYKHLKGRGANVKRCFAYKIKIYLIETLHQFSYFENSYEF